MLLYHMPRAPNARRVRIFLAEKQLEIPMREIDLLKREHKTPEYTKINPLQAVPALVLDDGAVITESVAICRYFERLHPEPPLFGVGAFEEAVVEMWQRRVEFGLFSAIGLAFRHSHPAMADLEQPQFPDFAEAQRARALKFLRFLEEELAARPFIAGEAFTIADITAEVAADFAGFAGVEIPGELKNFARWREAVAARPSAKA